jgi:esterase/lipase superfamily enzyme
MKAWVRSCVVLLIALFLFASAIGCSKQRPTRAKMTPPPPPPPPTASADGNTEPRPITKDGHPDGSARPVETVGPGGVVPSEDGNYAIVKVFYATDRQPTGSSVPGKFYGGDRQLDETLHLGTVDVSIPRDHQPGHIERPVWWKLEFRQDPEKHVVMLNVVPQQEQDFYRELSSKVGTSANKDALVFIHGFDNSFEQAAWRTAQLSYDLQFRGAPIMYSWPSKGGMADYLADEATIEWAAPHLEKFLETVAAESHATTVHLIAHSMGNRALTYALAEIARKHAGVPPMFKQVFLAAPDIDVGVFKQLATVFPSAAARVTLYASSKDKAIIASERIHQFDRVGDSSHICAVPGVDTIDASAVDTGLVGHAYFGDKTSILSDMMNAIETGSSADRRAGMHAMSLQQMTYWAYLP